MFKDIFDIKNQLDDDGSFDDFINKFRTKKYMLFNGRVRCITQVSLDLMKYVNDACQIFN